MNYPRAGASTVKRSEHALADQDEVCRLISEAGLSDVVLETVRQTIRFASPREYVRLQIVATPMAAMVAKMESEAREAIIDAITASLTASLDSDSGASDLTSPQEAFVVQARKAPDMTNLATSQIDGT